MGCGPSSEIDIEPSDVDYKVRKIWLKCRHGLIRRMDEKSQKFFREYELLKFYYKSLQN